MKVTYEILTENDKKFSQKLNDKEMENLKKACESALTLLFKRIDSAAEVIVKCNEISDCY